MRTKPGACRHRKDARRGGIAQARRRRKVEEKLPFRKAARAPTASIRRMTVASESSIRRSAASKLRTSARVSRQTWWSMSGDDGRDPTTTFPSRFAHHRITAPQPWTEASQVMTTMCAEPVSPVRKASCRVLATKGQSNAPDSQWAARISRRITAASLTRMAGERSTTVL
jgi:hypothetical protein